MDRQRKYYHFFVLFIGQTVSQMGSAMTSFAVIIWAYSQNGQVMASSMLAVCSAVLADYVFEPFMKKQGAMQMIFTKIVGSGSGAGIGLIFVLAGLIGNIILLVIYNNRKIRALDERREVNGMDQRSK